jgi:Amino acid synthesis
LYDWVRRVEIRVEEILSEGGNADSGPTLRRVVALAAIKNPYADSGWSDDLTILIKRSEKLGSLLGSRAFEALDQDVESFGKAAMVGVGGEQEHANACLTSAFGDAFRAEIGGGKAWLPSVTKRGGPGSLMDIPLCFKDDVWVRSHYDAVSVVVVDAPLADEIVVALAVANRGRINARLGGLSKEEALLKPAHANGPV